MQAIELLSNRIQPVSPRDKVAHALDLMDEFRTDLLPVVSGGRLVGMLKESAILENNRPGATVGKLMDEVGVPYVRDRQHFYDVLKLMAGQKLALVPVLDLNGKYLGVVAGPDALQRMAAMVSAGGPGSVLVLEMASNDYSLQQIARIVEDEGARVLSVFCTDLPDSMRMEVTLKVNREDVRAILQAFDRFQYTVRTTYQGPHAEDDLRARYEDLMRIINM